MNQFQKLYSLIPIYFKNPFFNIKDDDLERVSYLFSLILINQRGAHSKIDDINENIFPRYYYLPNLKFVIMKKKKEIILLNNFFIQII